MREEISQKMIIPNESWTVAEVIFHKFHLICITATAATYPSNISRHKTVACSACVDPWFCLPQLIGKLELTLSVTMLLTLLVRASPSKYFAEESSMFEVMCRAYRDHPFWSVRRLRKLYGQVPRFLMQLRVCLKFYCLWNCICYLGETWWQPGSWNILK